MDGTQTAPQLAAAALKSCSITQQQLAGLDSTATDAAGGAGALLFVDPELLQLEDPHQLHIMIQGLKVRAEASWCAVYRWVGQHTGSHETVLLEQLRLLYEGACVVAGLCQKLGYILDWYVQQCSFTCGQHKCLTTCWCRCAATGPGCA
jgi:hypothetical protein